jgi:peroxiredoxin (alkyl hydroperoxide reductase subunit C)
MANGLNVQEMRRLLVAMQHSDEPRIATPANWQPAEGVIIPSPASYWLAKLTF